MAEEDLRIKLIIHSVLYSTQVLLFNKHKRTRHQTITVNVIYLDILKVAKQFPPSVPLALDS
jgi:hypothetical protein